MAQEHTLFGDLRHMLEQQEGKPNGGNKRIIAWIVGQSQGRQF